MDFINRRGDYDELDYGDGDPPAEEEHESVFEGLSFSARESEAVILPQRSIHTDDGRNPSASQAQPLPDERHESAKRDTAEESPRSHATLSAPFLIQLSVVAADDYFNGGDLRDALVDLGLIHGDMGIYHRYDRDYREILFSVASLMEPGTFPIENMEAFECPGIVLFFQPPQVEDPLTVFDDLVQTCHVLAQRLDGEEWDERHEILTLEKIEQMRERIEAAY